MYRKYHTMQRHHHHNIQQQNQHQQQHQLQKQTTAPTCSKELPPSQKPPQPNVNLCYQNNHHRNITATKRTTLYPNKTDSPSTRSPNNNNNNKNNNSTKIANDAVANQDQQYCQQYAFVVKCLGQFSGIMIIQSQ